jgi:hypothetical protein
MRRQTRSSLRWPLGARSLALLCASLWCCLGIPSNPLSASAVSACFSSNGPLHRHTMSSPPLLLPHLYSTWYGMTIDTWMASSAPCIRTYAYAGSCAHMSALPFHVFCLSGRSGCTMFSRTALVIVDAPDWTASSRLTCTTPHASCNSQSHVCLSLSLSSLSLSLARRCLSICLSSCCFLRQTRSTEPHSPTSPKSIILSCVRSESPRSLPLHQIQPVSSPLIGATEGRIHTYIHTCI